MNLEIANAAALAVILALATWGALQQEDAAAPRGTVVVAAAPSAPASALVDARGQRVASADYQRIVSLNTVADPVLLLLVEPERLVAVSEYSLDQHPDGFRYAGRPGVARAADLEPILGLAPDLVVASKFADEAFMARLRDEDIAVFDLGEMRGVGTTLMNVRTLGQLLRQPERAARVESDYLLRLAALDAAVPDALEAPGLYLSIYGDSLFGGSAGSSYADLLHYAGVDDLAEAHGYREWPKFSPEQLLGIDPPLVVTQTGMADALCAHSTLRRLSCCRPGGRVVEVPGKFHSDPGLGLVHAAAALQRLVHPGRAPSDPGRAPSVHLLRSSGDLP